MTRIIAERTGAPSTGIKRRRDDRAHRMDLVNVMAPSSALTEVLRGFGPDGFEFGAGTCRRVIRHVGSPDECQPVVGELSTERNRNGGISRRGRRPITFASAASGRPADSTPRSPARTGS